MSNMLLKPLQMIWSSFCRRVVAVFYRRCETDGLELFPASGAVLLCANHANALADAVIIQAVLPRLVHPLARSGLFKNWLLKPVMAIMQAVPVYRRQDNDGDTSANVDSFQRCYDTFKAGEIILIFPEGLSHSDPGLRPIKTGAARMALGAMERNIPVTVLPIGLNFSNKGKFRSNVFIKIGTPVDLLSHPANQEETTVRAMTSDIQDAIESVTISVDEAEDLDFLKQVERFFAMRHGKYRRRDMALRFRALKKINTAYQHLLETAPEQLQKLKRKLHQFDRLCQTCRVNSYHITVRYSPGLVTRFILRSLFILLVVLPVGIWGIINSFIPFLLTRYLARKLTRGTDQYDTAKMALGLFLFLLFWVGQTGWMSFYLNTTMLLLYAFSLPVSAGAAIFALRERQHIWDNLRVFFLFVRRKKLKRYLEARRKELERELARLVRLAKRPRGQDL